MMHMVRILLPVVLVAVLLAGCPKHRADVADGAGTPTPGDWVVEWELSDEDNLNPLLTQSANAQYIDAQIYEALLTTDIETLEEIPWIADTLPTLSDDHLHYTFHIRKGVTFSDGHPVTGEDFIFAFKAIKNPLMLGNAQLRNYFKSVHDAELVNGDIYTLRFNLTEPYFQGNVWVGENVSAMPKHIWDPQGLTDRISWSDLNDIKQAKKNPAVREFAAWFEDPTKFRDPKYNVGSGPYVFKEWITNEHITLERNRSYWNSAHKYGTAYPDKLVYKVITDMNAAVTALKNEEVDFLPTIQRSLFVRQIDTANQNRNLAKVDYLTPNYYYLGWNQLRPIFKNRDTRWALSYLVDRKTISEKVYYGYTENIQSSVFVKRPEYNRDLPEIGYDPVKADSLLAAAGWKDSDGDGILDNVIDGKKTPFAFTMLIWGNPSVKQLSLILSEEYRKHGIKMEIQEIEWSVYLSSTRSHNFDATPGNLQINPSEGDMYQAWHSSQATENGSNNISFMNHEVDSLIESIRREFDVSKRKEMFLRIQKIIYDEQPMTFLFSLRFTGAYNKRFHGVKFYAPRPGYNLAFWWSPAGRHKYGPGAVNPQ
jgi:peptide/nickel transport system substrate-binding protein